VIVLSGAGSVAAVRLAAPFTLDEIASTAVLFFGLTAALIRLLGAASSALGVAAALAIPFLWLSATRDSSDSLLIWLVPVATFILILLAARLCAGSRRRAMALAASALALGALFWPPPDRPESGTKVVVVGWDGATWDLIDPFIAKGSLPNLERLLEGAHRAKLRSLPTMFSPRVWSTIATGCAPQVHGIMDFTYRKENFQVGRIWDKLKSEGRTYGLCGWYFTWPPEPGAEDTDFIVPSRIAPDDQVFPPKYFFYRQLEGWVKTGERKGSRTSSLSFVAAGVNAWRHGIRLSTLRMAAAEMLSRRFTKRRAIDNRWRSRRISAALQGDLCAELLSTRAPEFAALLFTQIDRVSHEYWKYMAPDDFTGVSPQGVKAYGRVIEDIYAECDIALGKIMSVLPEDVNVILVSDHGFQSLRTTHVEKHSRIRTTGLIEALGVEDRVFGMNVDNEVYLRGTEPDPQDRAEALGMIEPYLRDARLTGEESHLFEVAREDEILHLNLAPRPPFPENARVSLAGAEHPFEKIIKAKHDAFDTGAHHPDGIYVLSGPAAAQAVRADSLHVIDVAPTMAALLRLPISPVWLGSPAIEGASIAELGVAEYPPPSKPQPPPTHIDEELKKKLKALGYLE
jgi:hypothetical protein